MEDLPKIVRDRLAAPPPDDHPDADLLTAFSENSLVPRERAAVIRHLAVCAICREITSLALPREDQAFAVAVGMAASPPPSLAAPPRGLNLRWAALAICMVMVAAATWFVRRSSLKNVAVLPAGVMSSAKGPEVKANEVQMARARDEAAPLEHAQPATRPEPKQSAGAAKAVAKSPEAMVLSTPAKETASASDSANSARMASGAGAASSPAPESDLDRALEKTQVAAAQAVEPPPAAPLSSRSARTAQASIPASAPALARQKREASLEEKDKKSVVAGAVIAGDQAVSTLALTHLNAFTRWTLSDGKLRRSTDAGTSWEVIPIDQNATFRALSVRGEELWVGGKKGVLYHSPDNGAHWVRVMPSAGEESITEDIVRLEFADADHGKLITPHSQWTTNNCGATWQRQPQR